MEILTLLEQEDQEMVTDSVATGDLQKISTQIVKIEGEVNIYIKNNIPVSASVLLELLVIQGEKGKSKSQEKNVPDSIKDEEQLDDLNYNNHYREVGNSFIDIKEEVYDVVVTKGNYQNV